MSVDDRKSFTVDADPWLASVMDRPAFRVEGSGSADAVASHVVRQARGFYFAKVATERVDDVGALSRIGFSVVDTNLTFELVREVPVDIEGVAVGDLADDDHAEVLAIAGTAFRYSRFHLDPQVGVPLAHHIKREWVRSYLLGRRGDGLKVARHRGRVCGFLAPLISHGAAVIDLVAVAVDVHGQGVGSALTSAFAARYRGMARRVGTQIANIPSIRLYSKLGFALAGSHYVLHRHAGA